MSPIHPINHQNNLILFPCMWCRSSWSNSVFGVSKDRHAAGGRWHRYPELLVGLLMKGLDIGLKKIMFLLVSCRDSGLEATDRQWLKIL